MTGIAVLDGAETIRRFELISLRGILDPARRAARLRQAIGRIIANEAPACVVIEALAVPRDSNMNRDANHAIREVVSLYGLVPEAVPLDEARRFIGSGKKISRADLHRLLALKFRHLASCTRQVAGPSRFSDLDAYWERAFAALALAIVTYAPSTAAS